MSHKCYQNPNWKHSSVSQQHRGNCIHRCRVPVRWINCGFSFVVVGAHSSALRWNVGVTLWNSPHTFQAPYHMWQNESDVEYLLRILSCLSVAISPFLQFSPLGVDFNIKKQYEREYSHVICPSGAGMPGWTGLIQMTTLFIECEGIPHQLVLAVARPTMTRMWKSTKQLYLQWWLTVFLHLKQISCSPVKPAVPSVST